MKIGFFSDIHEDLSTLDKVESDMDLLLVAGDLTLNGGREQALAILEDLQIFCKNFYAISGNLDYPEVEAFLEELSLSVHAKGVFVSENIGVFGCGGSSPTPFSTPNEFPESKIFDILKKGYSEIADARIKIMLCHTPPINTFCDKLPNKSHVGSSKVREFIEKYEPDYCICGHIHEGIGIDKIGKTLVANAGDFASGHFGTLDTDTQEILLY